MTSELRRVLDGDGAATRERLRKHLAQVAEVDDGSARLTLHMHVTHNRSLEELNTGHVSLMRLHERLHERHLAERAERA